MGIFNEFLDALKDKDEKPLILPEALSFPSIDVAAIEQKLALKKRSAERGANNLPPADQVPPDEIELEIEQSLREIIRPVHQLYEENQKAYLARLAALDPFGLSAQVAGKVAVQKIDIANSINTARNDVYLASETLRNREREYRVLREQYGDVPEPNDKLTRTHRIIIIFLAICLEGYVNAGLLGPYMGGGGREAFLVAVLFPVVTVGLIGFGTGTLLRRVYAAGGQHVNFKASATIASASVIALLINMGLAYFRTAADIGADEVVTVGRELWVATLQLDLQGFSTFGFVLLVASMGLFGVGVYEFYKLDHPIPGFLTAYRARMDAVNTYRLAMQNIRGKLQALYQITQDFNAIYDRLTTWSVERNNLIDSQNKLYQKYRVYQDHCSSVFQQLVKLYRDINRESRTTTESVPSYFRADIKPLSLLEVSPLNLSAENREFRERLNKAINDIKNAQTEINREIDKVQPLIEDITVALAKQQ